MATPQAKTRQLAQPKKNPGGGIYVADGGARSAERDLYEKLRAKYGDEASISYAKLEASATLQNGKGEYLLNFGADPNGQTEQFHKLTIHEQFHVLDMGMYVTVADSTTPGQEILLTYVDRNLIAALSGLSTAQANAIEAIYNGFLAMTINKTVIFDALPTSIFKRVPQQQYDSLGTEETSLLPQFEAMDGRADIQPKPILYGNKKTNFTLKFPTYSGSTLAAVTANKSVQVRLHAFGFKITNVK